MFDANKEIKRVLAAVGAGDRDHAILLLDGIINNRLLSGSSGFSVARVALLLGEFSAAERAVKNFLKINSSDPAHVLQGCALLAECGKFEAAIRYVQPILNRSSGNPTIMHFVGTVFQQQGQLELADKYLRNALDLSKDLSGPTWLTLSAQVAFDKDESLFERLAPVEARADRLPVNSRIPYFYALGKAWLDRLEFDSAFDKFSIGANLARQQKTYDADSERRYVNQLIANFTEKDFFSDRRGLSLPQSPIFIVGLPRSGTTLLEQILISHKNLSAGGEFGGVNLATMHLGKASEIGEARLRSLFENGDASNRISELYAHVAQERFGSGVGVVDKSINNVFYMGVIAAAFPESPIIVLKREVEDVAWSCFRTCFSQGMAWSNSLKDIAAHFNNMDALISHWREMLGDRIIDVNYEDIVRSPDAEIPKILEACNLGLDESVFKFNESERIVTTSSTIQVRRPLYGSSISASKIVAHRMREFFEAYPNDSQAEPLSLF